MGRYRVPAELALRQWEGESTALVRLHEAGTTHLVEAQAAAVLQALTDPPQGLGLPQIAQVLGLGALPDAELEAGLHRLVEALAQTGMLRRVDDDADTRPAHAE